MLSDSNMTVERGVDGVFLHGFRVSGFGGFPSKSEWYMLPKGPFKISGRMGAGKTSTARLILFGLIGDPEIVKDYLVEAKGVVEVELEDPLSKEARLIRVVREVERLPDGSISVKSRVLDPSTGRIISEDGGVQRFLEKLTGEPVLEGLKDVFILRSDLEKSYQQLREKIRSLTCLDIVESLQSDLESLASGAGMRFEELENELSSFEEYLIEEGFKAPSRSRSLSDYARRLKVAFSELISKWSREVDELKGEIEAVDRELESLTARLNELNVKKSSLENLASNIKVKEEQIELMRKAYEDAARRVGQLEKEVSLLRDDLNRSEEKIRRTEAEVESLSKRLEVVESELAGEKPEGDRGVYVEREKQLAEAVAKLKPELERLREQIRVKRFNLDKDRISLQRLLENYASMRERIKDLPESIDDASALVAIREKFSDELEKSVKPSLSSFSSEIRFLKAFKSWLERKGFCPLCNVEIVNLSKEMRELEKHIRDVEKQVKRLQVRHRELLEVLKDMDKAIELQRSYMELKESIASKERDVEGLSKRARELEENLKTYELRLESVRRKLEGMDEAVKELEKERFRLKTEIERLQREREESIRVRENLRRRLAEAEKQLVEARGKEEGMKRELEEEERKLEELKHTYSRENYASLRREASELKRRISFLKASREKMTEEVRALEMKLERYLTLAKELEKRESRVVSLEKTVKLAGLAAKFLKNLEEEAKKEFSRRISKDLPRVGELLGIKGFKVDTGVLERLVLGRKVSQKVHTLSDGEFITLLSLVSGLLGAWSGGKRKRFLILDVPLDEETAASLSKILKEMNCLQPGFIFSKPGPLTVEPL
ncbi:MAG: hypothetical protein ACTSWP_01260 [Candidatus Freyarchaeota archaeon]